MTHFETLIQNQKLNPVRYQDYLPIDLFQVRDQIWDQVYRPVNNRVWVQAFREVRDDLT